MAEGDGIVYTTKELLARIEAKIELIDAKLDSKANLATVVDMESRISILRESLQSLRNEVAYQDKINAALAEQAKLVREQSVAQFTRREKLMGVSMAVIALGIQVWVVLGGSVG